MITASQIMMNAISSRTIAERPPDVPSDRKCINISR
jgi:hypothetical protein